MKKIKIRNVASGDRGQIWEIIRSVIAKGDTYVFDPDSSRQKMLDYWCNEKHHTFVAIIGNVVVGTFIIKDNQPDLGSHVANASFMTAPDHEGLGVGTAMGKYALSEARKLGYMSMQFNMVVKSNEVAIRLWQKLGFSIVGEVPDAFKLKSGVYVNAFIMWRKL